MRAYWTERKAKNGRRVYSLRMGGVLLGEYVEANGARLHVPLLGPFGSGRKKVYYAGIDPMGPWVMERPYVRL